MVPRGEHASRFTTRYEIRDRDDKNFAEITRERGGLPERPKGADCKSAGIAFDGSNPSPSTGVSRETMLAAPPWGSSQVVSAMPSLAGVAQLVERQPSKLNVAGSNPVARSGCLAKRPPSSVGRAHPW